MQPDHTLPVFAFLDVETTGLSPESDDRVCEIALLRCPPNASPEPWQTLINPQRQISPGAAAVNGITNEMVMNAPRFEEVAQKLLELIEGTVLVCHNAPFDVNFLTSELARCGKELPPLPVLDTLRVARQYFHFPSNSLPNIAAYIGVKVTEKHRALADVYTTYRVFEHFWEVLQQRGIASVDQLFMQENAGSRMQRTIPGATVHPLLAEAIKLRKKLLVRYLSRSGSESERIITPLEIINNSGSYLVAYCELRKEKRTFRLDRIVAIKTPK